MPPTSPSGPRRKVAVMGARGYSGIELCRLLLQHPGAELAACAGSGERPDWSLGDYLPEAEDGQVHVLGLEELLSCAGAFDAVFLATPIEASLELAPRILKAGTSVIDLSGAFRLPGPGVPENASYGLMPWAGPLPPGSEPHLIANPGCYATAVLMALIPLLAGELIHPETLVIDAKSGATGAGRKAAENLLFTEIDEDCQPYRVGTHQHLPEIVLHARRLAGVTGAKLDPHFVTHLLPIRRGIIAGLYARLRPGASFSRIEAVFQEAYAGYPLLSHGRADRAALVSLRRIVGSPRTQIAYAIQGDKLYLFSLIDNLLKGAASQAIENMNRIFGNDLQFVSDAPLSLGLQSGPCRRQWKEAAS